ncbi:MAG: glycosyl hydrolase family 65 protein [Elusimicrobiota bacterium]
MVSKAWLIEETNYDPKKELYWETIFALSNGYMASRGALEENHLLSDVRSYFGTYVAGIFDTYSRHYQAIVNMPDFFDTAVYINGEFVNMNDGHIENYTRYLDMYNGKIVRNFLWVNSKNEKTDFEITRFISKADPHLAVLQYRITPINHTNEIVVKNALDGNVANIDFHVSGYQLRDEKYYFINDEHEAGVTEDGGFLAVNTKTTKNTVCETVKCEVTEDGVKINCRMESKAAKRRFENSVKFGARQGSEYVFIKLIAVYSSKDGEKDLKTACLAKLEEASRKGYGRLLSDHSRQWNEIWDVSNVEIKGDERDQRNVRFNIYHLIQMGNKNNPCVNVGSRGLTSEMHYGNCFWDTEIFIMPFFIFSDPDTAKALVKYRYLTLPAAREKAKFLWFKGAMYPWMSSYPGHEQADYWEYANIAVHIVSDVAFGLMNYYYATKDDEFMVDYGLEMLIETARFWESRVTWSSQRKKYVMNLVKGPNEYGIVNNNTYTNWGARWNIRQAVKMINWAKKNHPKALKTVSSKVKFDIRETRKWKDIIEKIYINYDKKKGLYIEDDQILEKEPVDLKKMKPGKVITTELGYSWDTFLRLRIVKQADVLLLMYMHRENFTDKQVRSAWNFYEPITLHDSSLSYNTHGIIANELGDRKKAGEYFQQTARLDLEDVMANVFLGIHAANAGGTWQSVINGFCGMKMNMDEGALEFKPNLPARWKSVEFKVVYRGNLFKIFVDKKSVRIEHERAYENASAVRVKGNKIIAA